MPNTHSMNHTADHRRFLADRMRDRMLHLRMNQSDLARKMETSRDNVSGWTRGVAFPRPATLEKLAEALDCRVEDLVPSELAPQDVRLTAVMPVMEMIYSGPGECQIRLNLTLPIEAGIEILSIVKKYHRDDPA